MYLIRKLRCSPWTLIAFLCAYIYLVGLYFVYYNSVTLDSFEKRSDGLVPIHDHVQAGVPAAEPLSQFASWAEVMRYREARYERVQNRPDIDGPGERGSAVQMNATEKAEADRRFDKEAFNIVASGKVALDRSVRDVRDSG